MIQTDNQEDVIAFLSNPNNHHGAHGVKRIDTHCSILFLTGERAYKLKRAVVLPYLDYGTADKRRACCQAELTLNSRTAPQIYLSVQAISRATDGHLQFGEKDQIIDWVVVMRQFDPDALFDRLLTQGQITSLMLREASDAIAEFHLAAEITKDHGGAADLAETMTDNWKSFAALPSDLFDPAMVARLRADSETALERLSPLLERRRMSGHSRRCHGDLHLGNICLYGGRPILFDCIEFSDRIACIDVLYDLAFLVMDLLHRGAARPACDVFNRYLDRSHQADGLAAMPFFLALRATIRAHVSGLMAQRDPDLRLRARDYITLALTLLEPRPARLVAIGGLSGTGKSTLAQALAPGFGAPPGARVLRSDVIRKRLMDVAPETRLDASGYTQEITEKVYAALAAEAAECLAAGYSVCTDAVFARPAERAAIERIAHDAGVPFCGFWLDAPVDLLRQRVAERRHDASDATAEIIDRQMTYPLGAIDWNRLDASLDIDALTLRAKAFL